ncbi:DUF2059 domain-containing protein [Sphingomonas sp. XXL09]
MRNGLLLAAALVSAPVAAQGTGAGTITTARSIVAAMHIEQTLDPVFAQIMPLVSTNVITAMQRDPAIPATLKARLSTADGQAQVSKIVAEEIGAAYRARYDSIAAALSEEYSRSFSETELQAILSFYRSPAGAKLIQTQPAIQKVMSEQGRAIGREAGMDAFPKIIQRVNALGAPAGK